MLRITHRNFFSKQCGNAEVTKLLHSVNMSVGRRDLSPKCDHWEKAQSASDFTKTILFLTALAAQKFPGGQALRVSKRKGTLNVLETRVIVCAEEHIW